MHPQLSDKKLGAFSRYYTSHCSDQTAVCKEFIQALEQCHLSGWARLTGGCNTQKDQLNACLRKEVSQSVHLPVILKLKKCSLFQRLTRSSANRETGKERRVKAEQAWKEFNEE